METQTAREVPPLDVVDFRTYYQRRTRLSATFLFAYSGANFILAPVYRSVLLDMPAAPPAMLILEWGVIGPVCIVTALMRWRGRDSRYSETLTLVCVAAVAAALLVSRYLWFSLGAPFLFSVNSLFLTAAMATTGVDYRRLSAVAGPILLLEIALSYGLHGASNTAHYEALFTVTAAAVVFVTGWQVRRAVWQTWDEGRYFQQLSERDSLTGLLNRRAFDERARRVLARAALEHKPAVLALVDLDRFKSFNDSYGHIAGDRALKTFARVLTRFARQPLDLAARVGGEEFVVLWYDANEEWGRSRANALVQSAREMGIAHRRMPGGVLTASIGGICASAVADVKIDALLKEADANLYAAKRRGGDSAEVTPVGAAAPPPDASAPDDAERREARPGIPGY